MTRREPGLKEAGSGVTGLLVKAPVVDRTSYQLHQRSRAVAYLLGG